MEKGKNRMGSKLKRGREKKREADCRRERQSLRENLKWRGLRNDHWKRRLRILNK
jgi:hypothetical protein